MVNTIDLPKILLLWLFLGYTGDKAYRVQRDLNDQVQRKMTAKMGIKSTETKPLETGKPLEVVTPKEIKENIKADTEEKKVDDKEDKKTTVGEEAKKEEDAKLQEEKKEEPKRAATSEGEVAEKK